MPQQQGTRVQNSFIGGLNTEATELNFPPNSCTETDNIIIDETGRVSKRTSFDLEDDAVPYILVSPGTADVYSEFLWTDVAGLGTVSFVVQQQGAKLHFYDVSADTTVSAGKSATIINLSTFLSTGNTNDPSLSWCEYAQGNGTLFVTHPDCDPFFISYDPETSVISAEEITIQFRDFLGLTTESIPTYTGTALPAFADDDRPGTFKDSSDADVTATIETMKADLAGRGAKHFYNLLNQGWWQGNISGGSPDATSALGQWDAVVTGGHPSTGTMPSNNDFVGFFRSSETDSFDEARVTNFGQGNSPAPRGHFLLRLGDVDRQGAVEDDGYTLSLLSYSSSELAGSVGTTFHGFGTGTYDAVSGGAATFGTRLFDDLLLGAATEGQTGQNLSVGAGKDFKSLGGKQIFKVTVHPGLSTLGDLFFYRVDDGVDKTAAGKLTIYGKNGTAPTTAVDGTAISAALEISATQTEVARDVLVTDPSITWDYVWVQFKADFTAAQADSAFALCKEIDIHETITNEATGGFIEPDATTRRPSVCAFYAGRAWYGGLDEAPFSNNLYFSQIVERDSQYGKCYQQNDPTSEYFSDLLPSDGGVVRIPEMGKVKKLFVYENVLFVFATNGVWTVRGSGAIGFTATDYVVRKLSSHATQSPKSFVDIRGVPAWWSEEGIQMIERETNAISPGNDTYKIISLSDTKIRSLIRGVPPYNRTFVKGAYNTDEQIIFWLYNDATSLTTPTEYNSVLCYNVQAQAFYTWSISDSTPVVRGALYVFDSVGLETPKIAYPITDATRLTYADNVNTLYVDWTTYATDLGTSADAITYTSSLITNYEWNGEIIRQLQPIYVYVVLENTSDSKCYMQSIMNTATSGDSGKWSSKQELFNNSIQFQSTNARRLKVRGRGRVMQLRFSGDTAAGFTIIGWAVQQAVNQGT